MQKPAAKLIVGLIAVIVLALVAMNVFSWFKSTYNAMVEADENVKTAWSQVQNQYQRRSDLIPNLVNTVKGYATHERETLEGVVRARAAATQTTIDPANLDPAMLEQFQAAQGQLTSALSRLLVVVEKYPELKASESFRELQAQLEGTENRIAVERKRFNEAAQRYNVLVRAFPNSIVAGVTGFAQKPYFAAEAGAERPPTVDFGAQPAGSGASQ